MSRAKGHRSSDGCWIDGPPGPACGCQSCRASPKPNTAAALAMAILVWDGQHNPPVDGANAWDTMEVDRATWLRWVDLAQVIIPAVPR